MLTNWWLYKIFYIYAMEYYLAVQKDQNDPCHNTDKSQKHYAKWMKPDTQDHILYESAYI